MASIRQSFSISGPLASIPDYVIICIYKTAAPLAEIARVVWTKATDPNPFQYQFIELEDGVYIVRVYESADGVTLGAVRHDLFVDAVTNAVLLENRYYTGGGTEDYDPAAESYAITDEWLIGKNVLFVYKEGHRPLQPGVEYTLATDTLTLIATPIMEGEKLVVTVMYSVTSTGSVNTDPFARVIRITSATYAVTGADYNRTLSCIVDSGNVQTLSIPAEASIPDSTGFVIRHDGGAVNVEIRFNVGETALFMGSATNVIYLGIGDFVKIIKTSVGLIVTQQEGNFRILGKVEAVDFVNGSLDYRNQIPAYGGTTYDGLVYKRLKQYVDSLPSNRKLSLVSQIATESNYGFWGVTGDTIRPPQLLGMTIKLRDETPGTFQDDAVGNHSHNLVFVGLSSHGSSSVNNPTPVDNPVGLLANMATPFVQRRVVLGLVGSDNLTENIVKNISRLPVINI